MNARPVLDRIIIKQSEAQDKIGKFVLSDTAKEKPRQGIVIAVGPGDFNSLGKVIPMMTEVGDTVIYSEFAGQPIQFEGEEYIVIKEKELLVVL